MTISYKKGNILETDCSIIVHSVNHRGVMGAGLAKQLREKYPAMLGEYYKVCKKYTFTMIRSMGIVAWYHDECGISFNQAVCNLLVTLYYNGLLR